jgi:hypothetical protein
MVKNGNTEQQIGALADRVNDRAQNHFDNFDRAIDLAIGIARDNIDRVTTNPASLPVPRDPQVHAAYTNLNQAVVDTLTEVQNEIKSSISAGNYDDAKIMLQGLESYMGAYLRGDMSEIEISGGAFSVSEHGRALQNAFQEYVASVREHNPNFRPEGDVGSMNLILQGIGELRDAVEDDGRYKTLDHAGIKLTLSDSMQSLRDIARANSLLTSAQPSDAPAFQQPGGVHYEMEPYFETINENVIEATYFFQKAIEDALDNGNYVLAAQFAQNQQKFFNDYMSGNLTELQANFGSIPITDPDETTSAFNAIEAYRRQLDAQGVKFHPQIADRSVTATQGQLLSISSQIQDLANEQPRAQVPGVPANVTATSPT